MPSNAKYVGRPTKWGNPFKIGDNGLTREQVIEKYEDVVRKTLLVNPHYLDELKGKDLACWCPLDKKCHADILLKILGEGGKTVKAS